MTTPLSSYSSEIYPYDMGGARPEFSTDPAGHTGFADRGPDILQSR